RTCAHPVPDGTCRENSPSPPSSELAAIQPDPGQLMLVVVEMEQARARDRGEALGARQIGLALEFERADEVSRQPGGKPALDEGEQPRGIADDVAEEPVHGPDLGGVEGEGAGPADLDAGE